VLPFKSLHTKAQHFRFNDPSTHYRSFRRRVFPVSWHWQWQPYRSSQETEYEEKKKQINRIHSGVDLS